MHDYPKWTEGKSDWKDYPRTKDKLYLCGMNPATRSNVPWDDEDAEIWVLNEMPHYPFLKRYDRLFQIHPQWDWSRTNNFNDGNHPHWIRNEQGECYFCKGTGRVSLSGNEVQCPECINGYYTPPQDRDFRLIYMQQVYEDVPGSIALPLSEMTERFCQDGKPYYTSTVSYMLGLAYLMEFKEIVLYGFEMGTSTEYHYQRACAEYWLGYGRALGIQISAPGAGILQGNLYAFKDVRTGFRQQLEMRKNHLDGQLKEAERRSAITEGKVIALTPFKDHPELGKVFLAAFDENYRAKGFVNFLMGTLKETENMMGMYETYFSENMQDGSGQAIPYKDATKHLGLMYQNGR